MGKDKFKMKMPSDWGKRKRDKANDRRRANQRRAQDERRGV